MESEIDGILLPDDVDLLVSDNRSQRHVRAPLGSAQLDDGTVVDSPRGILLDGCKPGLEPHRRCTCSNSNPWTGTEGPLL